MHAVHLKKDDDKLKAFQMRCFRDDF